MYLLSAICTFVIVLAIISPEMVGRWLARLLIALTGEIEREHKRKREVGRNE